MLNYLATRPKLATFVTQALIQLYARITKLGWFDCQKDDYVFRNAITDVTRFLQVQCTYVRESECVCVCVCTHACACTRTIIEMEKATEIDLMLICIFLLHKISSEILLSIFLSSV